MFDLERAISEWRRHMAAGGIESSRVLDELESHLREDMASLISAGTPEVEALQIAASRLGDGGSVSAEFKKLRSASSPPLGVGAWLWAGLSTMLAAGLFLGFYPPKPSPLLLAHIFCLTAGYGAAFLTGGFGIHNVCSRWFRPLSPGPAQALTRAVQLLSWLSVGLVLAGLLLGMFWSHQNRGGFFAAGPPEFGTLCAAAWLMGFCLIQRFGHPSNRTTMLLCIISNIIVSLAWFGAGIVAHGNGMGSYWFLDAWLGIQLLFLAIGTVPASETAEA
jgi:hypothetical protein